VRLWKSSRTGLFFFITAFLVGALALLFFQRVGSGALMLPWLGRFYWWAAVLLTGLAFLGLLLFDQVSGLFPLPGAGPFRSRPWRALFVLRLVMLLTALAFLLISHSGDRVANPADLAFLALGLILVMIEELLGRVAFYNLVEPPPAPEVRAADFKLRDLFSHPEFRTGFQPLLSVTNWTQSCSGREEGRDFSSSSELIRQSLTLVLVYMILPSLV
jgi:hypothetical protein